jgi:hypothetical protein
MDISVLGIYRSALRGIKENPLVYLFLFIWGMVQGVILIALISMGFFTWLIVIASISTSPDVASKTIYITAAFIGSLLIVLGLLTAATKAGVLNFGAEIRRGHKTLALHFFNGIVKYTIPLFIGGIVVGMLQAIPTLAFLVAAKIDLTGVFSQVFTSGWNFAHSMELLARLWNLMAITGIFQLLIFFWISPWDKMLVLYNLPYPQAILKSFTFVFSSRHFLRVLGLIIANVLVSQIILILTNLAIFNAGLSSGFGYAYIQVLFNASSSTPTSFAQFLLLPFFIYTQLFLLPWPEVQQEVETPQEFIKIHGMVTP